VYLYKPPSVTMSGLFIFSEAVWSIVDRATMADHGKAGLGQGR